MYVAKLAAQAQAMKRIHLEYLYSTDRDDPMISLTVGGVGNGVAGGGGGSIAFA